MNRIAFVVVVMGASVAMGQATRPATTRPSAHDELVYQVEELKRKVAYLEASRRDMAEELQAKRKTIAFLIAKQEQRVKSTVETATQSQVTEVQPGWKWNCCATRIEQDASMSGTATPVGGGPDLDVSMDGHSVDANTLRATGEFRNTSSAPYAYRGQVVIYQTLNPGRNPPILGRKWFKTPLLEPGEAWSFKIDVPIDTSGVNSVWLPNKAQIENVSVVKK